MGAQLCQALALKGISLQLKSLGIDNHFGQSAYVADALYDMHGLNALAIVDAAKELIN